MDFSASEVGFNGMKCFGYLDQLFSTLKGNKTFKVKWFNSRPLVKMDFVKAMVHSVLGIPSIPIVAVHNSHYFHKSP